MPPLTRDTVTAASRIMLPTYAALYLAVGLVLLLQAPAKTSTAIYTVPKSVVPLELWGVLFIAVGAAEVVALLAHSRTVYTVALIPGAGLAGFWAALLLASSASSATASYTPGLWVGAMCVAQAASARSLAMFEVDP